MGASVWSPLAGGILTGKYNNGIPEGSRFEQESVLKDKFFNRWFNEQNKDKTITMLNSLSDIAKELDSTLASLALAWVIANQDVSVCMFGATRAE